MEKKKLAEKPVEKGEQQSKECKKIEEGKHKEKENIRNFI